MFRSTLASAARIEGPALFTPVRSSVEIHPAEAGAGVRFRRADIAGAPEIPAVVASVPGGGGPRTRNTVIGGGASVGAQQAVQTIEHVMSALAALGITDALVLVHGPEVPILDGSAAGFVRAIREAGVRRIEGAVEPLVVGATVTVEDAPTTGTGMPARITATRRERPGFSFAYELDYSAARGAGAMEATPLSRSVVRWEGDPEEYATRIAPARTFCLKSEAEMFRKLGMFPHLTQKEMLVLDDATGAPLENELRFPDEPARHKLLDLIGDLALLGRPLQADVVATRSGHALTHELVRRLS
jgi:UDP-3-O-acyl-N-acetylglucosamine deacetylase